MFACFLRVKINTEPQFWCFGYLRKISIIKTQQSWHVLNIAIFTVVILEEGYPWIKHSLGKFYPQDFFWAELRWLLPDVNSSIPQHLLSQSPTNQGMLNPQITWHDGSAPTVRQDVCWHLISPGACKKIIFMSNLASSRTFSSSLLEQVGNHIWRKSSNI